MADFTSDTATQSTFAPVIVHAEPVTSGSDENQSFVGQLPADANAPFNSCALGESEEPSTEVQVFPPQAMEKKLISAETLRAYNAIRLSQLRKWRSTVINSERKRFSDAK